MRKKLEPIGKPVGAAVSFNHRTALSSTRHDLFSIFAFVGFTVIFVGFARTFFLRFLFAASKMPLYLYMHGLLFSSWFLLFYIQSRLIASHRVDLHRCLGVFAAALAGLAVPVAIFVALRAGQRVYETKSKAFSIEAPPLALDLGACLAFTVFIGLALYFRRRSEIHKRLMLLGSCSILLPAIGRVPGLFPVGGLWGLAVFAEIVPLTFILYDTARNRRLHPAFGWGGLGIIFSWPTFLVIGRTESWLKFTEWLVRG